MHRDTQCTESQIHSVTQSTHMLTHRYIVHTHSQACIYTKTVRHTVYTLTCTQVHSACTHTHIHTHTGMQCTHIHIYTHIAHILKHAHTHRHLNTH